MSLRVPGGTFYREYSGARDGGSWARLESPATVLEYCLDRYEVTVGRFRKYLVAASNGWRPDAGSGKHGYLNNGLGVANSGASGGSERGWDLTWNSEVASTADGGSAAIDRSTRPENEAVDGVNWYDAYAFCIWDGGFLPTDAEWAFAAAGGSEQRIYPWSVPPTSDYIDCRYAEYGRGYPGAGGFACQGPDWFAGAGSPRGDGKWGQSDLAGGAEEWLLDWFADLRVPCIDCANLDSVNHTSPYGDATISWGPSRVARGGNWGYFPNSLYVNLRGGPPPSYTYAMGMRCARAP